MDPAMLTCNICPRQPDFSDISHLLTHISSKGHLAHLHKLQVKSHQEIAAAVQLTNYNQWYQRHGLANLLSERMLQKERKQLAKNGNAMARKRAQSFRTDGLGDISYLLAAPIQPERQVSDRNPLRTHIGKTEVDGDGSDLDYAPGNRARQSKKSSYCTPVKDYPPLTSSPQAARASPEIHPTLASTPTRKSVKLKGMMWPGMALFDAATPEEQRRRNQKKDGSVVRRMERLSRLVNPQETVYSSTFTMQKQRHIDDLEDSSSLVEGETPIKKPKPRVKRKALAPVSSNVPRAVRRKPKVMRTRTQRHANDLSGLPNIAYIPSSSGNVPYGLQSAYSPTPDENMEFRLAVSNLSLRKRTGNFTIFNDNGSPCRDVNRYSAYAPVQSLSQTYGMQIPPKPSNSNAPWLQAQNQNSIYLGSHYQAYRPAYMTYQSRQDVVNSKENIAPLVERVVGSGYQPADPLTWKSPIAAYDSHSSDFSYGNFSGYLTSSATLADPFGDTKNPLLDGLPHFTPETGDFNKPCALPTESPQGNSEPSKCDLGSPHDSNETISEPVAQ